MKKEDLERKLGQLAYQIGKKQQESNVIIGEIRRLQDEANQVATEIEKLDGK